MEWRAFRVDYCALVPSTCNSLNGPFPEVLELSISVHCCLLRAEIHDPVSPVFPLDYWILAPKSTTYSECPSVLRLGCVHVICLPFPRKK